MTFYELRRKIETKGGETYFFNRDTLKFFGETLSRMRLLKNKVVITDCRDDTHNCYVISATRTRDAFGHCKPYTYYHYFDAETYERVLPVDK